LERVVEWVEMTDKAGTTRKPPHGDRRSGVDRRKVDAGPPGKVERRRSLESRKPDVIEITMSDSEWGALSKSVPPSPDPKVRGE
jgi:hypothetical protein